MSLEKGEKTDINQMMSKKDKNRLRLAMADARAQIEDFDERYFISESGEVVALNMPEIKGTSGLLVLVPYQSSDGLIQNLQVVYLREKDEKSLVVEVSGIKLPIKEVNKHTVIIGRSPQHLFEMSEERRNRIVGSGRKATLLPISAGEAISRVQLAVRITGGGGLRLENHGQRSEDFGVGRVNPYGVRRLKEFLPEVFRYANIESIPAPLY